MQPNKIRLKDIATLAGVSEGTVDRVIHNRGKVSPEALEKVKRVLKEINYKPNLLARTLGQNKTYRIAALIPNPKHDPYWKQSHDGLISGELQFVHLGFHILVEQIFYDAHSKDSFQQAALQIYHSAPDGVIVAPLFYFAAIPFLKGLSEKKIPYVLFNTQLDEVSPVTFIGQDLEQSGRLAAELCSIGQARNRDYLILHIYEDLANSVHLRQKEKGFREYFSKKPEFSGSIHTLVLDNPHIHSFAQPLFNLLQNSNLGGVFVSTSKVFSVAKTIKSKHQDIRIIGYDLIKDNMLCLKEGSVDFLIHQNPMRQSELGIQILANHLLFNRSVPPLHLFPLEVISAENMNSYLSHSGFQSGIMV